MTGLSTSLTFIDGSFETSGAGEETITGVERVSYLVPLIP